MELIQHIYQFKLPMSIHLKAEVAKPPSIFKTVKIPSGNNVREPAIEFHGNTDVNVYLIEGEKGNLLIDAGLNSPDSYNTLVTELKNYGFSLKDISHILVTHTHFDHSGQAGKIKQLSNAELFISQTEMDIFNQNYLNIDKHLSAAREILLESGVPPTEAQTYTDVFKNPLSLISTLSADHFLYDGDKISFAPFEFVAMQTPGHSAGHICLYEPRKKFFFAGDTILPQITPNIGFFPGQGTNPLADYLNSLERIYELEINLAFPGHGPAFSGVRQIIENLVRHHEQRNREVMKVLQGKTMTAFQVTQEMPWMLDFGDNTNFNNMDLLDRRLAIGEATSHLEYLVNKGEVGKSMENGVNVYFA